jgi:4-hydroxybenzoate polyprenyltransferase
VYAPDLEARVSPTAADESRARSEPGAEIRTASSRSLAATVRAAVKALRPHQWVKNALIFVPAILAHAFNLAVLGRAVWAFFAFSLCASSVYVLNDMLDLHADRAHQRKRTRPFASGALPLGAGLFLAPLLLAVAFGLATALSQAFAIAMAGYYVGTVGYSFVLKRLALVDVLALAGLYTARLVAGAEACEVPISQWLEAFSLFFFLSLAFVKRYSEVYTMRAKGIEQAKGRGYRAGDLEQLSSLGAAAGYLSTLVLALYIHGDEVTRLYAHPQRLWWMLPLMLYWVSRVWLLAHRGQMHDDPIVFAIRDKVSYTVAALAAGVVWMAT